ncbi:hypothetical protein CfE428DRAFT_6377 [Chthoniobacter flavus Ellin428]|uniref:Uncharacterized protein n=1 Tax=Chthoniobacter flavus Ellin428 TaxID=497964 RepID=B4DBT6_9BACT|nr:hypothetical protein [Chthoniobacter flavus]EDY16115.1 hypothetical protein CfE428DRAFT_6377 [Chthoniobacter flavus Ellin428]TCO83969.1 hypothetical protein EV701_13926 [Chthoniobacter flavus]
MKSVVTPFSRLETVKKVPANYANDTNGRIFFIGVIGVIRGPKNLAAALFHSLLGILAKPTSRTPPQMLPSQRRADAVQNDVRHPLLHGRIPAIHLVSTTFTFEPAFRSHDVLYIGNF